MPLNLRPYQREAVDAFFDALDNGHRRQLITLPTGSGKTVVFGSIAKRFHNSQQSNDSGLPILVLAHRSELLDQAGQKIGMVWPEAFIGRVQGSQNEQLGEVILASTQTLVAGRPIRKPGLIIIDEAHHAPAEGTLNMLERLGVFESEGPVLLGVTATPSRSDKREQLGDVFDHLTYERTILQMILDGYLSNVRGIKVPVPELNLSAIRTTAGDYNAKDLSSAMNIAQALDAVVEAVETYAGGRKSIIFAVDVKHAKALAERFRLKGVACAAVDGSMPAEERASILADFAHNRLRTLVNCQLLTEGFDVPDVDAVVIARPTRSRALYTQMVGRGLRTHPNKTDAIVLDLTGASEDKTLQTFTRLMQSEKKQLSENKNQTHTTPRDQEEDELAMASGESVDEWLKRLHEAYLEKQQEDEKAQQVAIAINLFANHSRYHWQQVGDSFAISYEESRWAYLYRDGNDYWPVLELNNEKFMPLNDRAVPLEYAQGICEGILQLLESKLIEKDAEWRDARISKRQMYILDRYRIKYDITWTRGMASDALGRAFAKKRVRVLMKNFNAEQWRAVLSTEDGRKWIASRIERFRSYASQSSMPQTYAQ